MKIDIGKLTRFLDIIVMSDQQKLTQIVLNFNADGIETGGFSKSQQAMSQGLFHKKSIIGYEELGEIGIDGISTFISVLKRFKGEVDISVEGNLLTIASGKDKSVSAELADIATIENRFREPSFVLKGIFEINNKDFQSILEDVKINDDAEIIINAKDNYVSFDNTGKYKFCSKIHTPGMNETISSKFGMPLLSATNKLKVEDTMLKIAVDNDAPCVVTYENEDMRIKLLAAPRVEGQ